MTTAKREPLAIVGGGPGGYVAALRAAQLGFDVTLVERAELGGICLNWGCIPTKALLHASDLWRDLAGARDWGIDVATPTLDLSRTVARSRAVASRLARGVEGLLARAKVRVLRGEARFTPSRALVVRGADGQESTLEAAHTIIATGAHPRALPALRFDGVRVWSYRDALVPKALPASLAIIGAGAIGVEFASFYATLGTKVTLVERENTVLPGSDAEVSAFVGKALQRSGIDVRTGAVVTRATAGERGVVLALDSAGGATRVEADHVLVAIGLVGNTAGLGLEHTRVRVAHGSIVADAHGATDDPAIHAIGDVTGAPMLAHRASHQGLMAVEHIAGRSAPAAPAPIPACTYGHPQTASVGLTEEAARASGRELRVGRFPFAANGKALAQGDTDGFVKTLFDAGSGELLGAHIVGPGAPELIHSVALAHTLEATEADWMATVFPHPTLSEALHESVQAAWERPLHI